MLEKDRSTDSDISIENPKELVDVNMSHFLDKRLKEIEDENRVRQLRESYTETKSKNFRLKPNFFEKFLKTIFMK